MQIYPHALCKSHSATDLLRQLIISRHEEAFPPTWNKHKLSNFSLSCCPSAPCSEIRNEHGSIIGYCVGYYLTESGELLGKLDALPHPLSDDIVEKFVAGLSGCFIVLIEVDGKPRIYLDPYGTSPIVFAPSEGVAATSPSLVPYGSDTQDNVELIDAVGVPYTESCFPLGITPRHGVFRLLPGHYLDLDEWRAVRHWPKGPFRENPDTDAAISEIASIVNKIVGGVAQKYPIQMSLTAGQDSRSILACCRDHIDNILLFTIKIPDYMGILDAYLAKRIVRRFKLNHRFFLPVQASVAEKELYLFRTGCVAVNLRSLDSHPVHKKLDKNRAYLPGAAGELARGVPREDTDLTESSPKADIEPRFLLQLARAPETDELISQAELWRDELPCENALQLLDLFYIECEHGSKFSTFQPAYAGTSAFMLWPLNNRRIMELMLSLPAGYRNEERFSRDIIKLGWPELLEFPMNKWDFRSKVSCSISNPAWAFGRILRRISKIWS